MSQLQGALALLAERIKAPSAVLDFALDLAPPAQPGKKPWLGSGEIVTSVSVAADDGLVVQSSTIGDNATGVASSLISAWVSGGTVGNVYGLSFTFTTNQGRTDTRTVPIRVVQR